MNQSPQIAHLINNYTSATSGQQLLQHYLASTSSFPPAHSLALHNMATMNGPASLLNNFSAYSLAAVMASQSNLASSSPLSSTNSSTASTNGLNQNDAVFAAFLQAQGLNGLNNLSASSLLQKYEQSTNNNSQQSPSSVSNCSSPPTCSSVTPPTPPLVPTTSTTLQLLAAQHNLPLSTTISSSSSTITLSNSLTTGQQPLTTNTTNSSSTNNLSTAAAAAVLRGQSNLSQLVANSQSLESLSQKRLTVSPDDTSNELVEQYYNQLNALRLLNGVGLTFNNSLNNNCLNSSSLLSSSKLSNQQPMKDLAKFYSAINSSSLAELNSPINSSLSSSSSSTSSLQNTMTSLQQQHSQMMAAMAASTNSFANNAHMQLLSPNSIKRINFSIENILNPSFGKNQTDLVNSLVNQTTSIPSTTNLTSSVNSSPMSKLLEFKNNKNGLITSSTTNKLTNLLNNNSSTKQQISSKLEQINSNINGLSSIINNLNPSGFDFKLNTSKRKKRSSSSMDDSCEKDFDLVRSVKRKNSIDSDCSNSNSSCQTKLTNSNANSKIDVKPNDKLTDSLTNLKRPLSPSPKGKTTLPSVEDITAGKEQVPAWVFCTRYSDRPSSGPRSRKPKKKDPKNPDDKRPRTAFTSEQLAKLKQEFDESQYLSDTKRLELSKKLNLNESQIKIWFQNKRAKSKKTSSQKSTLAQQLSSQGLYNHSTVALDSDDEENIRNAENISTTQDTATSGDGN